MDLLLRLQESSFATWVSQSGSLLGYPTFLFLHTLGLATVAGLSTVVALRVLGCAPGIPLQALDRCFSALWAAFWLTAISGTVLLITDVAKLTRTVFLVKLALIALAVVDVKALRALIVATPAGGTLPSRARLLAVASFALWIGATTAGRLIAYLTSGPEA